MNLHTHVRQQLQAQTQQAAEDEAARLNQALRLLSKWRSVLIQNTVLAQSGTAVRQGPLKGLDFLRQSAEGCHIAKLLGCYEQPLQPFLEEAMATPYDTVLNIGCAEGYYAVGLARRMPQTQVHAFDLNPQAQRVCAELAARNGVSDRVKVGALFQPADFSVFSSRRTLVVCDIEGAEKALLDPQLAPALCQFDLIVESHECLLPGVTQLLKDRFQPSHAITVVTDDGQRHLDSPPDWFLNMSHLDQLLAVWEWRSGPTPWLVMKSRPLG